MYSSLSVLSISHWGEKNDNVIHEIQALYGVSDRMWFVKVFFSYPISKTPLSCILCNSYSSQAYVFTLSGSRLPRSRCLPRLSANGSLFFPMVLLFCGATNELAVDLLFWAPRTLSSFGLDATGIREEEDKDWLWVLGEERSFYLRDGWEDGSSNSREGWENMTKTSTSPKLWDLSFTFAFNCTRGGACYVMTKLKQESIIPWQFSWFFY